MDQISALIDGVARACSDSCGGGARMTPARVPSVKVGKLLGSVATLFSRFNGFGETEIQHLHVSVAGEFDIRRLKSRWTIPSHARLERLGDLARDRQVFPAGSAPARSLPPAKSAVMYSITR
jgi:hypothetical protein